jgi:glycine/D-amino acid oxidase-like deaminating enzyme
MDDVLIIGGGIVGSSIAYHLARDGRADRVCVVERDPSYEFASTPRSVGGVRQQFSLPENVRMSQYGLGIWRDFETLMEVDGTPANVDFRQQGYLFLAGPGGVDTLEANHRVQRGLGAAVEILDRAGLAARFPSLVVDDIAAGSFGPDDGWLDPHGALQGFRRKAQSLGARYLADEVVAIDAGRGRVEGVRLKSGERRAAGAVVNATGAWSAEVCALVGMPLPVVPTRRLVHFFEIRARLEPLPLVVDPSGLYFRPEGVGYICGRSNPDEAPGVNFETDDEYFVDVVWPLLAHRVTAFEALRPGRSWAGLYDLNRLDANLIIGPWIGGLENFHVACGFSGHGLQQAPAVGRAMAELLLDGRFTTLDLSRFTYQRIIDNAPLPETGIV